MKSLTLLDLTQEMIRTQGKILVELQNSMPMDTLLEALESTYENESLSLVSFDEYFLNDKKGTESLPDGGLAYEAIEMVLKECKLPEELEFHLISFPPYRACVENTSDYGQGLSNGIETLDFVLNYSQKWANALTSSPITHSEAAGAIQQQIHQTVQSNWLKFRTNLLKKMGISPFSLQKKQGI
jgi:hypothetical protein